MTRGPAPFLGWPGWGILGHTLLLSAAVALWFALVYGGADLLTGLHSYRVRIHLDAELLIPFVPVMVLGYLAIYPLFAAAPFILRDRSDLHALSASMAGMILVAGVCFLLLPSEPAFPPPVPGDGILGSLYLVARRVALRYNMVPSLHVGLSTVCVAVYAARAGGWGKVVLWGWAGLVAASTVFIHQHHVLDVVTGFALALAGKRFIYDRWPRATAGGPAETLPPSPSRDRAPSA